MTCKNVQNIYRQMPDNFSADTDPFYLAPITTKRIHGQDEPWFMRMPVGRNKLNSIMKAMVNKSSLTN